MELSGLLYFGVIAGIVSLYLIIPDVRRRNIFLTGASLLLVALMQPAGLVLYLMLLWMTFRMAGKIRRGVKSTLIPPLAVNLAIFVMLRYLDVFLDQTVLPGGILLPAANKLIDSINGLGLSLPRAVTLVPVGFPFYILLVVMYLWDVYRGTNPAEKRFDRFLLYFFMFPKFFQGPVVRYRELASSLRERKTEKAQIFFGLLRFCTGLGKKVLIADACGRIVLELAESGSDQALIGSWLAAALFFFRIFFDFSGCCDMAIGLGRVLGFRFPENFNRPYQAMSVTEFCERWNLTLRRFFLDYIYHPLEKGRGAVGKFLAIVFVTLLYGLWHGGTYNYLIFAAFFACVIFVEKIFQNLLTDLPYWLRHTLTVLCLMLGWVIFTHTDLQSLATTLKAMIGDGGLKITGDGERFWNAVPLIAVCWIGVTALPGSVVKAWRGFCGVTKESTPARRMLYLASCVIFMAVILLLCVRSWLANPVMPAVFMML